MQNDADTIESGRQEHWDAVYAQCDVEQLGWHEEDPEHSIAMVERCAPERGSVILDIGSGASTLVPHLLGRGLENVVAVDISPNALAVARRRLPPDEAERVTWVIDDVLKPTVLSRFADRVDVWHDRALFHFLTTDGEREAYVQTMRQLVAPDGHVIIAAFSLSGVERCSGLPVVRYDRDRIAEILGAEFLPVHSFECVYVTPGGEDRPYVYTLFRRVAGTLT